ncbi:MAG: hypothetical protein ACPGQL_02205 [Thermoplasmatota archaeon]
MTSDPHCPQCASYEQAVMDGEADKVQPCDAYEMTDGFRDWMVDAMRAEVMGQVSLSGLDRLAILKPDAEPEPSAPDEDEE